MKYLRIIWVRIFVSLLGGGMLSELMHISTGDPNRPMETNPTLIFAVIIFVILSFIIKNLDKDIR